MHALVVVWVSLTLLTTCSLVAQQAEVTIGAQAWNYDRVYPLLDGLFQDASSTQILALTLNPNTTNSSQVNALIQSFQLQAGYNQLSNVQNSVASQMAVANLGLQSTLAQQQQSILQQQIVAQQQLNQANQTLSTATRSGNSTQIATAQQAVNVATANVNSLASEAALIKGPSSPYAPSGAGGSIATAISGTPSSLVPTTISGAGLPSGGPSFPATKQLDNQMDLLWSRLARVVGTMARPDSLGRNDRLYLVEFDTATFPNKSRKHKLLEIGYSLVCSDPGALTSETPTVADMFPRVAAVNVTETKYKDSSFNLGAVLAFFGFGLNAAYNREHLDLSQTLGQSSYITGYGVGQSTFGWRFGIPLGDDIISADIKRTFVLVDVPSACNNPLLQLQDEQWLKLKESPNVPGVIAQPVSLQSLNATMAAAAPAAPAQSLQSISFNRISYDPTKYNASTNPALVTLEVILSQPVDQQATVYANGVLLRRARDSFGRAIATGVGSGGLLEEATSISQPNTWMPVSSRSLLVNLDGGMFGAQFPAIQVIGPGVGASFLISGSKNTGTVVTMSGQNFQCATTPCQLPSVAYPQTVSAHVGVTRWTRNLANPNAYTAVFTVVQPSTSTASTTPTASTSIQLVTGATENVWGENSEVYMEFSDDVAHQQYKLSCDPPDSVVAGGERLVCDIDTSNVPVQAPLLSGTSQIQFHIIDSGHTGGPLEAWTSLSACAAAGCLSPTAWDVTNPTWIDSLGQWTFQVEFVNVSSGSHAIVTPTPPFSGTQALRCSPTLICTATFAIRPQDLSSWFDHMDLQIQGDATDRWHLLNVRNLISPIVAVISADFTSWTGANLVPLFDSANDPTHHTGLMIGGSLIPIDCPVVTACAVTDKSKLPANQGIMYLQAGAAQLPLLQMNADGTTSPIMYQPPKAAPQGGAAQAQNVLAPGVAGAPAPGSPNPASGPTNGPGTPSPAAASPLLNPASPSPANRQAVLAGGPTS